VRRQALVATYGPPQYDRDSGSRRVLDMMLFLRDADWDVTFLAANGLTPVRYARELRRRGIAAYDGRSADTEALVADGAFELALLSFWQVGERYGTLVRKHSPTTRIVIDSVDLQFLRDARRAFVATPKAGRLDSAYAAEVIGELNAYAAADGVLAVSEREADLVRSLTAGRTLVCCVPDAEDSPLATPGFDDRKGILFVGSFRHPPNAQAVEYLCREILPRVDERLLAEHPVWIVGDGATALAADAWSSPHVHLIGWVPALGPYFERARVSVVPLRYGAGTKRKLIQSLAAGLPVVTTSTGAEGLGIRDREDVLVADTSEAFAAALERLLHDGNLWGRLRQHGLERVRTAHARDRVRARFLQAVENVLSRSVAEIEFAEPDEERYARRLEYQSNLKISQPAALPTPPVAAQGTRGHDGDPRLVAFYLPQFHPIPENDRWWGEGFTEWRNVVAAKPLFDGHEQPRLPSELGFYDLRLPEVREAQADLARQYGISAFCYYHYWFHGKQLLERPFEEVLASGRPDFPFCLCWANEPWSRNWDGSERGVLQPQVYSEQDDLAHIAWLLPALRDERALRIDGKPAFAVYQARDLPDPDRTADVWRGAVEAAGLPDLYLMAVETGWDAGWDATQHGFDAKVLFAPQFSTLATAPRLAVGSETLRVYEYDEAVRVFQDQAPVSYRRYETVCPGWDNSPRTGERGVVLHKATPESYERWLVNALERVQEEPSGDRVVFINAWNEWAEGCHLEPDLRHGRAYLEATRRALETVRARRDTKIPA
jgi:glycosyltransferase involved in cell wall biosynthesis